MIHIYNTLTQKKEIITKKTIKIYTCGITVHDNCHIGHARFFVVFDVITRYLTFKQFKIILIRNITDIDDKIIKKALIKNISIKNITTIFINKMHCNNKLLKLIEPTFEPKATNFISNIIQLINILKKKQYAYIGLNNDIYYNIRKYKSYGVLSKTIQSQSKISVKNLLGKEYDLDFTLWKNDKLFWKSPWGNGRPGWHSECAAMTLYYGENMIDIHGGGKDLLFPHHENELAQINIVKNFDFIKIWMHIGHLKINKQKMSKSLNNYVLIKNLLKIFNEEEIRFFFLLTHYRKSISYSINVIEKTTISLKNLYKNIKKNNMIDKTMLDECYVSAFFLALNDDFNTPKAVSILFEINNNIKHNSDLMYKVKLQNTLYYLGNIIGLFNYNYIIKKKTKINKKKLDLLINKRMLARKNYNWVLADSIRLYLNSKNIILIDNKNNTHYIYKQ